jgi:putative transposase
MPNPSSGSSSSLYVEPKINDQPTLETLTEDELEKLIQIGDLFDGLLSGKNTTKDKKIVATILRCDQATVYRNLIIYKAHRNLHCLVHMVRRTRTGGRGKSRLTAAQDAIIEDVIFETLKGNADAKITKFMQNVDARMLEHDVQWPCESTLRSRWNALTPYLKHVYAFGKKKADEAFHRIQAPTPECTYVLERVQFDHTLASIWVVSDDEHRMPIGRPWVTLAICEFSRAVLAVHVSLDAPSSRSLAHAVTKAVLPKYEWLKELGIEAEWPFHGKFSRVYTDSGTDFTSESFRAGCAAWRIRPPEFRPKRKAWYGGIIERLIGISTEQTLMCGGSTTRMLMKDPHDDRSDAAKSAIMTLKEYERFLALYFATNYHMAEHTATGLSPIEKWRRGVDGHAGMAGTGLPEAIRDPKKFYLDFLERHQPTLQRYGVLIKNVHYTSPLLAPLIKLAKGSKFTVKRDPGNIRFAYLYDGRTKSYINLTALDPRIPAVTESEWSDACRKAAKNKTASRKTKRILAAKFALTARKEQEIARKLTRAARKPVTTSKRRSHERQKNAGIASENLLGSRASRITPDMTTLPSFTLEQLNATTH